MKYIDADKLKELLKERQEEKDYREVIWLIDSLQQEQSIEGLEEEIQRYFDGWGEIGDGDNIVTKNSDYIGLKDLPNIARHFAEWGAEHSKK